jgi:hypothetical protein
MGTCVTRGQGDEVGIKDRLDGILLQWWADKWSIARHFHPKRSTMWVMSKRGAIKRGAGPS